VLPFPTWSIPRYAVPVIFTIGLCVPLLLPERKKIAILAVGIFLNVAGTVASLDPVTRLIFGTYRMQGQTLYATDHAWRGADRAMYNLQLPAMTKRRNQTIQNALEQGADYWAADCDELKLGEKLWMIAFMPAGHPAFKTGRNLQCVHSGDREFPDRLKKLPAARVAFSSPADETKIRENCGACTPVPLKAPRYP
jgi:hypothetical protein